MNLNLLVDIIIALLVAGFVFWALRAIAAIIPMEPIFRQVVDVLIVVVAVAIVLFYVVIPILHLVAGVTIHLPAGIK
jgi:hypothetical protein